MVSHTQKKAKSKLYPAETMTDSDYADDLVLLANRPAQAEFLQHSPEQAARNTGPYKNVNKTVYILYFKWQATKIYWYCYIDSLHRTQRKI